MESILAYAEKVDIMDMYKMKYNNKFNQYGDGGNILNDPSPKGLRELFHGHNLLREYTNFNVKYI